MNFFNQPTSAFVSHTARWAHTSRLAKGGEITVVVSGSCVPSRLARSWQWITLVGRLCFWYRQWPQPEADPPLLL